jgi:hypothetical protein
MGDQLIGGRVSADFLVVVRDTEHRRIWLLTKALEHAPLAEALILAQAAEDFVTKGLDGAQSPPSPMVYWPSMRIH